MASTSTLMRLYWKLNKYPRLRLAVPYIATFLVAFGLSLVFWRITENRDPHFTEPDFGPAFRPGKKLTKVSDISKDLQSQLDYAHEQNAKIHRARNLAIDKMLQINQQKLAAEKQIAEHARRVEQKEMEIQQEREKYENLRKRIQDLQNEIRKMQEFQRLMGEEHRADEHVKKQLMQENKALKNKLVRDYCQLFFSNVV